MDTQQALASLKQGNQRFLDAVKSGGSVNISLTSLPSASSQSPKAVVVSCSDSRVTPEVLFDCELGEIFVIRVAGNIITETELGSIEFACQKFGTRLVIVLGHTQCGAIAASISASKEQASDSNKQSHDDSLKNIATLVEQINPAIESTLKSGHDTQDEDFHEQVEDANVRLVANNIVSRSSILQSLSRLKIVGAKYDLASGRVSFFDWKQFKPKDNQQ